VIVLFDVSAAVTLLLSTFHMFALIVRKVKVFRYCRGIIYVGKGIHNDVTTLLYIVFGGLLDRLLCG